MTEQSNSPVSFGSLLLRQPHDDELPQPSSTRTQIHNSRTDPICLAQNWELEGFEWTDSDKVLALLNEYGKPHGVRYASGYRKGYTDGRVDLSKMVESKVPLFISINNDIDAGHAVILHGYNAQDKSSVRLYDPSRASSGKSAGMRNFHVDRATSVNANLERNRFLPIIYPVR